MESENTGLPTVEDIRLIHLENDKKLAALLGISLEELISMEEDAERKLREEAALLNKISYQDFVAWTEELSQQLPEDGPYRAAFLDGAKRRWGQVTPEDTMAVIDTVELDFQAMKRSAEYREGGGSK